MDDAPCLIAGAGGKLFVDRGLPRVGVVAFGLLPGFRRRRTLVCCAQHQCHGDRVVAGGDACGTVRSALQFLLDVLLVGVRCGSEGSH